jgi:hypothetical protein
LRVEYELIELAADGRFTRSTEVQRNRFFDVEEMEVLLVESGLEVHAMVAAYAKDSAIDDGTFHVLAAGSHR